MTSPTRGSSAAAAAARLVIALAGASLFVLAAAAVVIAADRPAPAHLVAPQSEQIREGCSDLSSCNEHIACGSNSNGSGSGRFISNKSTTTTALVPAETVAPERIGPEQVSANRMQSLFERTDACSVLKQLFITCAVHSPRPFWALSLSYLLH